MEENNNITAGTESTQVSVDVQNSEPPESERNYDSEYCPGCGAKHTYWNDARRKDWLGLGETDWCLACGSAYEHSAPWNKKPLSDWRPAFILQMARDVEYAYENISKPMTQEQIVQNREYLKRLLEAIASNLYHIPDRVEKSAAEARWEELRGEAAALVEELYGMGRIFYKNLAGDFSESELIGYIDDLKIKLAEKIKAA